MTIADARKICPELVLVEGEDLSPFRDVSKKLFGMLLSYSWNKRVERLGLDEIFLDVTDMVEYNVQLLNHNALEQSFFCLSKDDPEQGFAYDATAIAGCRQGSVPGKDNVGFAQYLRVLVASHLARYLRLKIEEEGYTSACGISSNKVLSKLAGNRNKPRNQTTLVALDETDVLSFMDPHPLRKVPGIGARITRLLEYEVLSVMGDPNVHSMECTATVGQVRMHPGMSPQRLDKILGGPGSERGIGDKVWRLLRGVDATEVKPAAHFGVPTQISIEDTYAGLNHQAEIDRELRRLGASLLRRMHVDLLADDDDDDDDDDKMGRTADLTKKRWTAHPRTLRLTTRPKASPGDRKPYNWARSSRSQPLPGFVFSLSTPPEDIVDRLAAETLLPMFRRLNPEPGNWRIGLINVCVANMTLAGNVEGGSAAAEISPSCSNGKKKCYESGPCMIVISPPKMMWHL
jgi:DNA polymerase iota